MSKAEMSRLRIAATVAVNELSGRVAAAQGAQREALKAERTKAARLESAARQKEIAAVLQEKVAGATATLTAAADTLEAEVARLKQSATHLRDLGNALTAGTRAVNLFKAVAG